MANTPTAEQLASEMATVQEAITSLQALALEDRGWDKIVGSLDRDMTVQGRKQTSQIAEVMTAANPLLKRGLTLRTAWVWGDGCEVRIDADTDGEDTLDTGTFIAEWLEEHAGQVHSQQAGEQLERMLYTRGAVVTMLHHDPASRTVTPRIVDSNSIEDVITDPDDVTRVWYYRRTYTQRTIGADGRLGETKTLQVWHPHIDHHPVGKDRVDTINKEPVRWDQRMFHVVVNKPANPATLWGFGDSYAAIPWARMSKEFLEQWAVLMRALSRYAWRSSTKGNKVQQAAATAQAQATQAGGGHWISDAGTTLEAVPKAGATIDAESGRPLQEMVASALDVPLAQLISNASTGANGSRSAQETLDQPTELAMGARRRLWASWYQTLCGYVLDQAAADGKFPGASVAVVAGRRRVTWPEGTATTVTVDWPAYDSVDLASVMDAVVKADQLDKLPPLFIVTAAVRALAGAVGIDDVESILNQVKDDDGQYLQPKRQGLAAQLDTGDEDTDLN